MIDAKELRIGNWVLHNNEAVKVFDIGYDLMQVDIVDDKDDPLNIVNYSNINPIPLTEVWLEGFGFEREEDPLIPEEGRWFKQYALQNNGMRIINFHGWICQQGFINNWDELTSVAYVHQLQNLYFALTGEELDVCH